MAFAQGRPIQEGNYTATIYGLLKDQKFGEAIGYLSQELQVGPLPASATRERMVVECASSEEGGCPAEPARGRGRDTAGARPG